MRHFFKDKMKNKNLLKHFSHCQLIAVVKVEGDSLQLHWVECCTQAGKTVFRWWAERALAEPVNGSCSPLNQCQPQSAARHVRSKRAWKNYTFFTSRIWFTYVIPNNLKKGRFLANRKPAQTINRMCLTVRPNQFSQMCSFLMWILIHLCEAYKNIWLAQTEVCTVFQVQLPRSASIVFTAVTHQNIPLYFALTSIMRLFYLQFSCLQLSPVLSFLTRWMLQPLRVDVCQEDLSLCRLCISYEQSQWNYL